MSGATPLQQCGYVFRVASNTALGICALGDALKALDVLRIEDQSVFISGIGELLNALGVALLDTTEGGVRITETEQHPAE
ncbi:MAG: hypothetical protein WC681_12745 [Sterolibacterium sp.]|jgi:hypothetical protein